MDHGSLRGLWDAIEDLPSMNTEKIASMITVLSLLPLALLIAYLGITGQWVADLFAIVPFLGIGAMQSVRALVRGGR